MTIEEAIKKGGFHSSFIKNPEKVLLDPSFWQSLGKALGWNEDMGGGETFDQKEWHQSWDMSSWIYHWHSFIDHLAAGKTAEEFFKALN